MPLVNNKDGKRGERKEMIKVCAFVDPVGSFNTTPESEYKEMKDLLEDILEEQILFKSNVPPWYLSHESYDCYIIDYGGIAVCQNTAAISVFQHYLKEVKERPSTLFILWSAFSENFYERVINDEMSDFKAPNVIFASSDVETYRQQIREWFLKKI